MAAADKALETGSADELAALLSDAVSKGVKSRFAEARAGRGADIDDVKARRYAIHAYVTSVHYAEAIYNAATASGEHEGHQAEKAGGHDQRDSRSISVRSTDDLKHEHRVIEVVLTALDRMADQLDEGKALSRERAEKALETLRVFADKCHHGKEEQQLPKVLESRGMSREMGPLAVMLHEHGEGRTHVRAMVEAAPAAAGGDPKARAQFAQHAHAYVVLLRGHIQKEDQVLFPMAEQTLTAEDGTALVARFEEIERSEIGEGVHERYHQWAHELAARFD